MGDLILSLFPGGWIAGAVAAIGAVLAIWFGGRRSAKSDAKAKAGQDRAEAWEDRNEVENRIDRGGVPADRLRERWGRD